MTSYSCCAGFDQQPLLNHYDVGKRRMSVHLTAFPMVASATEE